MKRKIITTADGSKTIHIEDWNEQYHSKHGALQEASHVFIKQGLEFYKSGFLEKSSDIIHILEIGFGTGLNSILTLMKAQEWGLTIDYTGVEAYPIEPSELQELHYKDIVGEQAYTFFQEMHQSAWDVKSEINSNFNLTKQEKFFKDINDDAAFHLIYFDAFGARVQPELWTEEIFKIMYKALSLNGVLVTYSAKGSVRRAMQTVGFKVERLPGPPGKREMLRAIKSDA